jgi:hypothetical protein
MLLYFVNLIMNSCCLLLRTETCQAILWIFGGIIVLALPYLLALIDPIYILYVMGVESGASVLFLIGTVIWYAVMKCREQMGEERGCHALWRTPACQISTALVITFTVIGLYFGIPAIVLGPDPDFKMMYVIFGFVGICAVLLITLVIMLGVMSCKRDMYKLRREYKPIADA